MLWLCKCMNYQLNLFAWLGRRDESKICSFQALIFLSLSFSLSHTHSLFLKHPHSLNLWKENPSTMSVIPPCLSLSVCLSLSLCLSLSQFLCLSFFFLSFFIYVLVVYRLLCTYFYVGLSLYLCINVCHLLSLSVIVTHIWTNFFFSFNSKSFFLTEVIIYVSKVFYLPNFRLSVCLSLCPFNRPIQQLFSIFSSKCLTTIFSFSLSLSILDFNRYKTNSYMPPTHTHSPPSSLYTTWSCRTTLKVHATFDGFFS